MNATPQCCSCWRFVNVATAVEHVEWGDYGAVHSVEYECKRCAEQSPTHRPGHEEGAT